jgi:REP element-mobilizing transposase RayT
VGALDGSRAGASPAPTKGNMAMKYNSEIHHRRSIRLKEYDYANAGAYFVTICTWKKEHVFGKIVNSEMIFSQIGGIIQQEWHNIPIRYKNVELDAFIIMPNHLHGILNVGASLAGAPDNAIIQNSRAGASPAPTLGDIIGSFKSLCIYNCRNNGLNAGKLWQRNYYEHIIRDEYELNKIREYIICNPLKWDEDEYNPNLL